jgi:protein TonB
VTVQGTLTGCQVLVETPTGLGFAEAALKAAAHFRFRPMMVDCAPNDLGKVIVPINFRLP